MNAAKTNINGVCHGPVGGSRHRAASAGGRATWAISLVAALMLTGCYTPSTTYIVETPTGQVKVVACDAYSYNGFLTLLCGGQNLAFFPSGKWSTVYPEQPSRATEAR